MPDEACFTCDYIQTTFADQISRGNTYRCSHCGKPIGKPPSVPPSSEQFWLLTGDVPAGPFTVAQVHAELAGGRATWQTPACPIGGSAWLPLLKTPGIGPVVPPPRPGADPHPAEPSPPAAPHASPREPAASGSVADPLKVKDAAAPLEPPASPSKSPPDTPSRASPNARPAATAEPQASEDAEWHKLSADLSRGEPKQQNLDGRFWLLVGAQTTGPFRISEIRSKYQSGELPADAKARRVGTEVWLPLINAVGSLPPRLPAKPEVPQAGGSAAADRPTAPVRSAVSSSAPPVGGAASPAPSPAAATPSTPKGTAELVGAAIGIGVVLLVLAGVGYGVYWVYEQVRPDTATEVCKKLDEVKTAAEAKKYATPRMHPFLDATYADKSALDPNMTFEWTEEVDGPVPNTKLVGFRGAFFVPEAGQRVRMEGHCKMVRADGWKVDDMIVTGVEGASLPGPVSLVDEHRKDALRPKGVPPGSPTTPKTPATTGGYKRQPTGLEAAFYWVKDRIGWGGIGVLFVLFVIGALIRESYEKKKSKG